MSVLIFFASLRLVSNCCLLLSVVHFDFLLNVTSSSTHFSSFILVLVLVLLLLRLIRLCVIAFHLLRLLVFGLFLLLLPHLLPLTFIPFPLLLLHPFSSSPPSPPSPLPLPLRALLLRILVFFLLFWSYLIRFLHLLLVLTQDTVRKEFEYGVFKWRVELIR